MSKGWEPHDEFLEDEGRRGIEAIEQALRDHGLTLEKTLTSRDVGVDMARYDLQRDMPGGWHSWQLPVYLLGRVTFFFLQVAVPGTILPSHAHEVAQFRVILSGGLIYTARHNGKDEKDEEDEKHARHDRGIELKCGDWIYTPPDAEYTLSVATNPGHNAIVLYCY